MADVLKGNFKTRKKVEIESGVEESLEDRFEREAMARLGGSIAFVSKKKVVWGSEDEDKNKK